MSTEPESPREEGLLGSLRLLVRSLLQVVVTRVEIFSTELAEERFNLTTLALVALTILFCIQAGLILAVLFLVLAVSNEHRLMALGIGAGVLLLGALGGVLWLRAWLKSRPPMFGATLTELRKDRERLRRGI
jgi:uncharacterized membrane protein YqjE